MNFQTINWVNSRNNTTMGVQYLPKSEDASVGVDQDVLKKHLAVASRVYNKADLSQVKEAGIYRDPADQRIHGDLQMKDSSKNMTCWSSSSNDKQAIPQVLNNMGNYLNNLKFAGKKPAPIQPQAKQPLSLLA